MLVRSEVSTLEYNFLRYFISGSGGGLMRQKRFPLSEKRPSYIRRNSQEDRQVAA